jgi:VanZ family protein
MTSHRDPVGAGTLTGARAAVDPSPVRPEAIGSTPADPTRLDRGARRTAVVLLLLIAATVAIIVFTPGPPDPGGQDSLHLYLDRAHLSGLPSWIDFSFIQNLANVVLFIPLGFLGSLALRRRNYLVVLAAAGASGLIELVQLILLPDRVASLQDVLCNTIGALIGFLLSIPALRRRRQRRRRYVQGRQAASDSRRRVSRTARLQ